MILLKNYVSKIMVTASLLPVFRICFVIYVTKDKLGMWETYTLKI